MVRVVVSLVLASAVIAPGCTSTQAPIARRVGMVASIGGVVGITAGAAASAVAETDTLVGIFSVISAIGIGLYAAAELTDPRYEIVPETTAEKHQRWARILTERAFRYAREGNCPRVRRVEKRVHFYDRAFHDGVFMRDEAIAKCMSSTGAGDPVPVELDGDPAEAADEAEPGGELAPPTLAPPRLPPPPVLPPPSSVRDPAEPE
ncbi:MAG: hypothetical protein ACKV2T_18270 [Kofleriaceae bacterium]